jgi:hypothetical protein
MTSFQATRFPQSGVDKFYGSPVDLSYVKKQIIEIENKL